MRDLFVYFDGDRLCGMMVRSGIYWFCLVSSVFEWKNRVRCRRVKLYFVWMNKLIFMVYSELFF